MRVKPGASADDIFAGLTKKQQNAMLAIERTRAAEDAAVLAVTNRSREAVRKALEGGVPARLIASRLGVSAARVYQMRDEAVAYAEGKTAAKAEETEAEPTPAA